MRLIAPMLLALSLLAAPAVAQDEQPYVWNAYTGTSVAFGVPDTDDRALRIDCEGGETLVLIAPVDPSLAGPDGRINIVASSDAGLDMITGGLIELGDGPNVRAPLPSPSDALAGLMAGGDLTLMLLGEERVIPGAGAAAVLGPLLKACGG